MTAKQFLNGRTTAHLGRVDCEGLLYHMRLSHSAGIGCVKIQLRLAGMPKWTNVTGRFSDESALEHIVGHTAAFTFVDSAKVFPVMEVNPSCLMAGYFKAEVLGWKGLLMRGNTDEKAEVA